MTVSRRCLGVLAVVATAAGAGWVDTAPPPGEPTMAEALEEARAATFELLDVLAGFGLVSPSASMNITRCHDFGRMSEPASDGRFLHPDGRFSTLDDARRILDLFVKAGWEPVRSDRFPGGIENLGADRYMVAVRRGELWARVGLWTDQPYVLFSLNGRCLPNSEEERRLYIAIGHWDLLGPEGAPPIATAPATTVEAPPTTETG